MDATLQNSWFSYAGNSGMTQKKSTWEAALGGFVLFMQNFGFMQSENI